MLKDYQDAQGHQLWDYLNGGGGYEITERGDGYTDASGGAKDYFAEYKDWPPHQKRAIQNAKAQFWISAAVRAGVCSISGKRVWRSWA